MKIDARTRLSATTSHWLPLLGAVLRGAAEVLALWRARRRRSAMP